jgi:uncharacterized protein
MMADAKSNFVWYELMTTDVPAAAAFYSAVVGWGAQDAGLPGPPYTLLTAGETMVGGLMPLPEEAHAAGGRPGWLGYIGVDDIDAFAARVKQAGGAIHRGPDEIPSVGRFAVAADPQGAMFVLFQGGPDMQPPPPVAPGTPGHTGWHDLRAVEWQSAFAFYSGLFGWTKAEAVDMGPGGLYQTFAAGGAAIGGMMTRSENGPAPGWLYYFNVEDIDAAAARTKDGGGKVQSGPHEVPGGRWIIQGLDPQGAAFALVGPRL